MCLNKVFVRDLFHLRRGGSYFPCGKCPACRQALANRRANKIRQHDPDGFIAYFITLSFSNKCLPYVLREELITAIEFLKFGLIDSANIPVYRDTYLQRRFGQKSELVYGTNVIGYYPLKDASLLPYLYHYEPHDGDKLSIYGIRTKLGFENYYYDPHKISIAYLPDVQTFIKRLRSNLQRRFKEKPRFSYYNAPEYGPTSQRFHIHLLIWFDRRFTQSEVKSFILEAWPFCDPDRLLKFIEVARCPSHYVASYVNCSADIPEDFVQTFKNRSSHSLHFGFNDRVFSLSKVVEKYERQRIVTYHTIYTNRKGQVVEADMLYPSYFNRRFFPKVKGFNRCSRDSLLNVYLSPTRTLSLGHISSYTTKGIPLYTTNLIDVYGIPVSMTEFERNYFLNSLDRFFADFNSIGLDRICAVNILLDYYTTRNSYLYRHSFDDDDSPGHVGSYYNLIDVYKGFVDSNISEYLDCVDSCYLDSNTLPTEVEHTRTLIEDFSTNIKHRKISNY